MKKRGQVSIFVIVAVLIVSAVLIFFLWIKPKYIDVSGEKLAFEDCMADVIEGQIGVLGEQGGFAEPEFYYLYEDKKIGYLCYTNLYYNTCVMQKPFVKQHFEKELEEVTREEIYACYNDAVDELKAQGYDVVVGDPELKILLEPNKIVVELDAPTSLSKQTTSQFENFETNINSPIYDILMIATSLLQYESMYGDSDIDNLMRFYPDYVIDKIKRGDETKVYIIEHKETGTKFQFASRSVAWPAGYGIDSGLVRDQ